MITSTLIAFPIDKNNIQDEIIIKKSIPNESRVIIGEGAKVIVGTTQSAKLLYDKLVLVTDAKLIESEEGKPNLSDLTDTDAAIEISLAGEATLPTELSISKAYPNPFNPVVNISYGLPKSGDVKILIHDLSGRKIADFHLNQQAAGWHEFNWNALDQWGQTVGSGIYLITIQASNMVKKQKITFLK
ncbi:T9SS type A sorting domain-containing protein [Candidatus Neomarinimicrobiota bacterium]